MTELMSKVILWLDIIFLPLKRLPCSKGFSERFSREQPKGIFQSNLKVWITFCSRRLSEKLGYVSVFRIDAAKDRTHAPGHIRGAGRWQAELQMEATRRVKS